MGRPRPLATAGKRAYQPEEYAAFVHERSYAVLASRPFVWGTYVWAMFDFGSGIRYEGDLRGVNTKGLVTFDRQTRKDPFYFYKANWSTEPVTYIVGRRYTDRAYSTTDVKVYSNADTVQLEVNGAPVATLTAAQCPFKTCVFQRVALRPGKNVIAARGTRGNVKSADEVVWTLSDADHVNIAAGQLATGLTASNGTRYGSDNFFTGGAGRKVVQRTRRSGGDATQIKGVAAPPTRSCMRRSGRAGSGTTSRSPTAPTAWCSDSSSHRRRWRLVAGCSTSMSTASRRSPAST